MTEERFEEVVRHVQERIERGRAATAGNLTIQWSARRLRAFAPGGACVGSVDAFGLDMAVSAVSPLLRKVGAMDAKVENFSAD